MDDREGESRAAERLERLSRADGVCSKEIPLTEQLQTLKRKASSNSSRSIGLDLSSGLFYSSFRFVPFLFYLLLAPHSRLAAHGQSGSLSVESPVIAYACDWLSPHQFLAEQVPHGPVSTDRSRSCCIIPALR
jgi:hypothetical protein